MREKCIEAVKKNELFSENFFIFKSFFNYKENIFCNTLTSKQPGNMNK